MGALNLIFQLVALMPGLTAQHQEDSAFPVAEAAARWSDSWAASERQVAIVNDSRRTIVRESESLGLATGISVWGNGETAHSYEPAIRVQDNWDPKPNGPWSVEFSFGVKLVEWAMFGARQNIDSGGTSWNLRAEDAMGGAVFLQESYAGFWLEKYFEYTAGVLTTADRITFSTLGVNIGYQLLRRDDEYAGPYAGVLFTIPRIKFDQDGLPFPGDLKRSFGGQAGFRYAREFDHGPARSARFGFSAEAAIRYCKFRFNGDPGVSDSTLGGLGLVIALTLFVSF